MTSKDTGVSEHNLINLIYQHLKENGHEKAANVLKKTAPQVEATSGKVSLNDIFNKWVSSKSEKKSVGDILKAKVSKPKAAKKAAHITSFNKNDKSQKKKRSRKKDKSSSLAEAPTEAVPELVSISLTTGDDSDSDSSLDVEKWKRLALELSDADIGKMDTTKKRKPARNKKDSSQNTKTKKSKAKTVISSSKTGTKKNTSTFEKRKNTTPSKKLKDNGNLSEFLKVQTPETKFDEQTVTPKRDIANGHSETDNIKTPTKKVKHKKTQSFSESSNTETPAQTAESVEPEEVNTSRKNAKPKKTIKSPEPLETPSRVSDTKISKSNQSKGNSDLKDLELSDIPSKKAKSKKSVKYTEPLNADIPSEGVDSEIACIHMPSKKSKKKGLLDGLANPKPAETPSKKSKKFDKSLKFTDPVDLKKTESEIHIRLLTSDQLETTSKNAKPVNCTQVKTSVTAKICAQLETPSKKSKAKTARALPETGDVISSENQIEVVSSHQTLDQVETPSKKATPKKTKSVVEPDPVEVPCKKAKRNKIDTSSMLIETQKMEDHTAYALSTAKIGNSFSEYVMSQTPSKKSKSKKATKLEHVQSPAKISSVDVGEEESSKMDVKKKRENKDEGNIVASDLEEGPTEPKKRKKGKEKKKETEGSIDEVLPLPEEVADNPTSSPNKKKKKKKKYNDEEEPLMSVPPHEEKNSK